MVEQFATEFLNSLSFPALTYHVFKVKVGAPVILLRNLNPRIGLYNGTRIRVQAVGTRTIQCVILSGPHANNVEYIPRIPIDSPVDERQTIDFIRE